MGVLANKINIKQNEHTYQCECYTIQSEATPTGGNYLNIKNNGVNCFLGLQIAGKTSYDTPVQIKKNNIVYNIQTKVVNARRVVIQQSEHQTIKVNCNGQIYTTNFNADVGTSFTVTVEAEQGYLAGAPNIQTGNIPAGEGDYIISASPASKARYLITINQRDEPSQIIYVNNDTDGSRDHRSNFNANYGDVLSIWIRVATGFYEGKLSFSGSYEQRNPKQIVVKGNLSINIGPVGEIMYTISVTQPQNGNITVNGQIGTSFSMKYNSQVAIQANANEGYKVDALYIDDQV